MRNINISVDGGGTNLRIIAFDDDLNFIAESKSGSVNPNFESAENIAGNMAEAVKGLFLNLKNLKIKNIYETIVGSVDFFNDIFIKTAQESGRYNDYAADAAFHVISEGYSHLYAASLVDNGGIALSGTGSGALIYFSNGRTIHVGGYGIPVGDEGSGAWIGMRGISAAIKNINGWGEKTILTEKLYKYFNIDSPDYITSVLYKRGLNQRSLFAGFCRYVAESERAGDNAARDIIYSAGRDMGLQMLAAIKRAENLKELPVIYASGGAWKGSPYMLETMAETIRGVYPDAVCKRGIFDPVMGGAVKFIFDKTGVNLISEKYKEHMKKEFKDYLA